MLVPLVVVHLGKDHQGLDIVELLDQRLHRPVHAISAGPDSLATLLADDRTDCVVCGPTLSGSQLQRALFEVADQGGDEPVFDLTGAVVDVPGPVDIHQFESKMSAAEAADEIVGLVLDSVVEGTDNGDQPASTSRGLGQYLAVEADWRVTDWDPRLTAWTGVEPSSIVGRQLWEALPSWGSSVFAETCRAVMNSREPTTTDLYHGPGECWLDVRVVPAPTGGIECFIRDITEHKSGAAGIEGTGDFESTLDRITDAFFALDNREQFVFLNSQAEFLLDVDAEAVEGERFWDVFPAAVSTTFYREFKDAMEAQEETSFEEYYRPLNRWFEVNAYPSEDGLSVFLRDVTEQVQLQGKLQKLHDVTRELIVADSDTDIAARTVDAAEEVLEFPLVAVWRYNDGTALLDPIAWSPEIDDRVEEMTPLGPESRFIWAVYESGERRHLGFVPATTSTSHHPGSVTSELLVPVGEYGVLGAYADERDAFDETDVKLFRLLASTVESAFARTQREREIAQRNERLDEFASVVSHDLRNPLNIASGHIELARGVEDDEEHLDRIVESLRRMERLIEDLLARARGDRNLDREHVALEAAAWEAWAGVDTGDATLDVRGSANLDADLDRLIQLFENLFRNAVEHGGPTVAVAVGTHQDGFYVADDGPGIPAGEHDAVFEQGVSGVEDGTGYGLSIVADIVEGHGWRITATDGEAGGARFEVSNIYSLNEPSEA